ncbi:MAG: hypothetical protein WBO58_20235 [Gammaproteobacteria bacterium]
MKGFFLGLLLLSTSAYAGEVRIIEVSVECPGSCTFSVTLEHGDQGWGHYANQWDVVTLDGKLLKSRVLHHPHEQEQPFTRSLSGVFIPAGESKVKIRARDSKHGYSKQECIVDLPGRS